MSPELRPETGTVAVSSGKAHQYVNFLFMRVDPAFYSMLPNEKVVARQEFLSFLDKTQEKLLIVPYSLAGLRADCDLLFWRISDSLETLQDISLRMRVAGLGKHLRPVRSLLTLATPPIYESPGRPESAGTVIPGESKYLFIYPFKKTREWYRLPETSRNEIMKEHLSIAQRHPGVRRNPSYLMGLDDNDFVAAYESDEPELFAEFLQDLRASKASTYTPQATPIFTCVRKELGQLVESFG